VSVGRPATTVFALGVVFLGACRHKQEQSAAAGSHQVPIICTRCEATGTLTLASEAERVSWPKACPSCKRWAAYASGKCKDCGKLVPLRDVRTGGFGYPPICPFCGKPWQH
jgi:hypothetical protein